jgi:hypothetical protein
MNENTAYKGPVTNPPNMNHWHCKKAHVWKNSKSLLVDEVISVANLGIFGLSSNHHLFCVDTISPQVPSGQRDKSAATVLHLTL